MQHQPHVAGAAALELEERRERRLVQKQRVRQDPVSPCRRKRANNLRQLLLRHREQGHAFTSLRELSIVEVAAADALQRIGLNQGDAHATPLSLARPDPEHIELVGHVPKLGRFDLRVPLAHPTFELCRTKLRVSA